MELNSRLYPKTQPTPLIHSGPRMIEPLPGIGSTIMKNSVHGNGSAIAPYWNQSFSKIHGKCAYEIEDLSSCLLKNKEVAHCQTFADKLRSCNSTN